MTQDTIYATYPLDARNGVTRWLKCGVLTSPLALETTLAPDGPTFGDDGRWVLNYWAWDERSKRLKQRIYDALPPFTDTPDMHARIGAAAHDGKQWQYAVTEEDQVIDFSRFNFTPTLMQGWLCTLLNAETALTAQAELLTIGPARVFVDGALHTHFREPFSYVALQYVPLTLDLKQGMNVLHLHGEMLGWREARLALGLRFTESYPITTSVPLPDGVSADDWQRTEDALEHVHVKQFAFPTLPGKIYLDAEASATAEFDVEIELPIPENVFAQLSSLKRPKAAARICLEPGGSADLPLVPELTAGMSGMPGENSLMLTVRPVITLTPTPPSALHSVVPHGEGLKAAPIPPFALREKGLGDEGNAAADFLHLKREIWAGRNTFSSAPYGDYEERRAEALRHLAAMPFDIPATLAALEIGAVDRVSSDAVALACHFMEQRYDCADFYAIGLLALLYGYSDHPVLHTADKARIESAFLGFKYWLDEPGLDAMCYFTENHQILFHVAAYLAGQLWQERTFSNSGYTGRQQMRRNQPRIENWIIRRLQGSFSEWDSNAYMTLDAFAMLALVEFANSSRLREMATALLDKLFFMLACQSFRGVLGSTHGRCYVTALKSARVENTSALGRIAWGMGLFNGETRATGLLALARRYRVPDVLQHIGADTERTLVTQARSFAQFRPQFDMRGDTWDVRTLTYRTSDVMLSAALDYRPGEMGIQEHLWQATLGPEAVVFTTYPGNSQEHGNARPNFWAGSARLPRVAMHDRTVICLYQLQPDVGLGISHAYFPTAMFDEWRIDGQWAFARVGSGYIALWGDGHLVLTDSGRHVAQELRSRGAGAAWVCRVGGAAQDGDFAAFQRALMTQPPHADGTDVQWTTPDGAALRFGWEGALTVDNQAQDWDSYPHYANVYTDTPMDAPTMTIAHAGESLTIDLQRGRSLTSQAR
ncbi:MAG: hypothetical protein SF123_26385 [Chloroflexota bacterium]|nr:hypothetical protein [Chloroflexota bacterium]